MINKYGHISYWNTKNISDMSEAFLGQKTFNEDISGWNVSKVTYMSNMFSRCHHFNSDLSAWDVRRVKDMSGMFAILLILILVIGK